MQEALIHHKLLKKIILLTYNRKLNELGIDKLDAKTNGLNSLKIKVDNLDGNKLKSVLFDLKN